MGLLSHGGNSGQAQEAGAKIPLTGCWPLVIPKKFKNEECFHELLKVPLGCLSMRALCHPRQTAPKQNEQTNKGNAEAASSNASSLCFVTPGDLYFCFFENHFLFLN
jgi:hypothetical protein